jgi:hypothetical protein
VNEREQTKRKVIAGSALALGAVPGLASAGGNEKGKGRGNGNNGNSNGNENSNGNGGGPPSDAKNTRPDGTVLLAKYEVEDGKSVFKKNGDFVETGDGFEFTVIDTKDGSEVLAFDFEDPNGVYDVCAVSVKTGAGVFRKRIENFEGSFDASEFDSEDPVHAVSNVILCSKVFWQVDLGIGEVPEPPDYSSSDSVLLLAAIGGSEGQPINPTDDGYTSGMFDGKFNGESIDLTFDTSFNIGGGTAEIGFSGNDKSEDIHLASFEQPGPFKANDELQHQDLFNSVSTTEESKTLTVDLPTLEDYSWMANDRRPRRTRPSPLVWDIRRSFGQATGWSRRSVPDRPTRTHRTRTHHHDDR